MIFFTVTFTTIILNGFLPTYKHLKHYILLFQDTLVEKVKKAMAEDQAFRRIFAVIHIGNVQLY